MIAELKRRCERAAAEPGQGRDTASHLDRLAGQWNDEARRCEHERRQLNYQSQANERNADRLLYTHGESRPRPVGNLALDAQRGRQRVAEGP